MICEEIISRKEAANRGLKHYFTGSLCGRGHRENRFVKSKACVVCNRHASALIRLKEGNSDRVRAYKRRWAQLHREQGRQWGLDNIELRRSYNRNRKARKKAAEGSHTGLDIREILRQQRNKCAYYQFCGTSVRSKYHVDHIIPLVAGGSNYRSNLQILCPTCNMTKQAKDPMSFSRQLGMLL